MSCGVKAFPLPRDNPSSTPTGYAPRILAILQRLELPLVLTFNRSRVMVLPQAISKATGLRHAHAILRLSPHNTVAIGDAENDHELLRLRAR